MRAPQRKRPLRRVVVKDVSQYSLNALSEQVKYVGSPESIRIFCHLQVVPSLGQMPQFVIENWPGTRKKCRNGCNAPWRTDVLVNYGKGDSLVMYGTKRVPLFTKGVW